MNKGDLFGIYLAIAIIFFFWIQSPEIPVAKTVIRSALWPITAIELIMD